MSVLHLIDDSNVFGEEGVRVEAQDQASIRANSEVVALAISQNTINGFKDLAPIQGLDEYDFSNASGEKSLKFGDLVRFDSIFGDAAGTDDSMYRFIGLLEDIDLGDASHVTQQATIG